MFSCAVKYLQLIVNFTRKVCANMLAPLVFRMKQAFILSDYFCFCTSYQKLLQEAKGKLGEILSAFEFLDVQSMNLVTSSDTL